MVSSLECSIVRPAPRRLAQIIEAPTFACFARLRQAELSCFSRIWGGQGAHVEKAERGTTSEARTGQRQVDVIALEKAPAHA